MSSYSIILRRYSPESARDEYSLYASADSLNSANHIALEASGNTGDILIVCDTAYISDLQQYYESIHVIDWSGNSLKAPNGPKSVEWIKSWERLDVGADKLLDIAYAFGVDDRLIVLAACACARTVLKYIPKEDRTPLIAIETAEAWAMGEATEVELIIARNNAYSNSTANNATAAVYSAARAATASNSARNAAAATDDFDTAIREMSQLVREHIPLRFVLLAACGAIP